MKPVVFCHDNQSVCLRSTFELLIYNVQYATCCVIMLCFAVLDEMYCSV